MPVSPIPFDLTVLVAFLQQKQQPVLIHDLAYLSAAAYLHSQFSKRQYAPGATYQTGETIWHKGQSAQIVTAQWGQNQKQGRFQMLQLRLNNGEGAWLAAAIPSAPANDQAPTPETAINQFLDQQGLALRTAIQESLAKDSRFVHFQGNQGDEWCLSDFLPAVSETDKRRVYDLLAEETKKESGLRPQTTNILVQRLWNQPDNGTPLALCRAFALDTTLQQYAEFHYLVGGGWLLRDTWDSYRNRAILVGPRLPNVVPHPIVSDATPPSPLPTQTLEAKASLTLPDIQEWKQKRRLNTTFTLTAHHLIGQWLPLSQDTLYVLPPCPMVVRFHCQWGEDISSFTAYVDPESGRVLTDLTMADIFRQNNIYPGAKLIISRRENWQDYDLRLKPLESPRQVRVRRLDRDEQGQLIIYDDVQLVVYEIDENEFVAQARWEVLEALFQQAHEAGAGIFQLMFETCQRWERELGQPLLVTEAELFEAIHTGPRMTSRATIALEMWQRNAFERQADGRYLFRPEQGDMMRPQPTPARRSKPFIQSPAQKTKHQRRLRPLTTVSSLLSDSSLTRSRIPFHQDANILWQAVIGDAVRQREIETAIGSYQRDVFREKMMLLRGLAHLRIHKLLAQPRLSQLTMDGFNQHVWQIGSFKYQGQSGRIDKADGEKLLSRLSVAEMKKAFAEGQLVFTGNQTWGSATGIYAPQMKESPANKLDRLRQTLDYLLYNPTPIVQRLEHVLNESNGFGINIVTGLLHAVFPNEFILYNQRSADMLTALGVDWPLNWRHNVPAYLTYRDFCLRLREQYNFLNLTDVDWFIYGWGQWHTGEMRQPSVPDIVTPVEQTRPQPEPPVFSSGPRPQITTIGDDDTLENIGQPLTPFWMEVQKLEGEHLFSKVTDSLVLDITEVRHYGIVYSRHVGREVFVLATLLRVNLEPVWNELVQQGERRLSKEEADQPGFSILAELPGVRVAHNPLRLLYRNFEPITVQPTVPSAAATPASEHTRTGQIIAVDLIPPGPLFAPPAVSVVETLPGIKIVPASFLATPASVEPPKQAPDDPELAQVKQLVLSRLVGETIYTPQGKPNRIAAATDKGITVITESGESHVPWSWIADVYNALRQKGALERQDVQEGEYRTPGGFRSAFIFGLLACFTHILAQTRPRTRLVYQSPRATLELRPFGFSPASSKQS